jgi:CheY-like chemotaxis protein
VLKDENIHLILLDIMMPDMSGFKVCEKLKQDASTKDIPVIFLTAHTETENVIKGFQLGAVDYVTKPFRDKELITRVETHLKLKATEEQLREKLEELKEANATKDKFFSIIAHDLKNMFNGLVGLSSILTSHQVSANKNETFLQLIQQTSENGFDLLENLLEWSRMQTGKIKAQPRTLHLEVIVNHNIELLVNQAKQKNINMVSHVEKTEVFADEYMLNTVFRNLLSNAVKFTPANG